MNRHELEHLIRASGAITDQYEFVIVGSQSILGAIPHPEAEFKMSAEADIYPWHAPELADKIDGRIGEGSEFHLHYGFYAQGVGSETAILPDGWQNRLHRVQNGNTDNRIGWCLDVADLFMICLWRATSAHGLPRAFAGGPSILRVHTPQHPPSHRHKSMPLSPTPIHYTCPACHWSKTVAPRSDALTLGDYFSECPTCGHTDLDTKAAGALQGEVAQVLGAIEPLWKSRR